MNKTFVKLTALLALASAFVLGACVNPLNPPEGGSAIPAGKGLVRVEAAAGAAARTLTPSSTTGFNRFEYWFAKDEDAAVQQTAVEGVFSLDPGNYTVTVKAFAAAGEDSLAAQGTSAAFTIARGEDAGSVTVALVPATEAGQGTLSFDLTYPEGTELKSFTLTRLAGDESFDLTTGISEETGEEGTIFSGEKAEIGAGYWLARVSLSYGDMHIGKSEVAHIYRGLTTELAWAFDEEDFAPIPVISGANSGPGTLREALERVEAAAQGGTIFIDLPEGDKTITLTSPLPKITANLTIEGNGATLTQSGITPGAETQLLYINDTAAMVKISRLHFKGAIVVGKGGAIHNKGDLTLESCIFSDNQQTSASSGNGGDSVYSSGSLTVMGCTFYRTSTGRNALYLSTGGSLSLAGNVFFNVGNLTAGSSVPITSFGYNIMAHQTWSYQTAGDVLGVTALVISPVNFKPITGSAAAEALTTLPENYPTTDFYGAPIEAGGASGAVQALIQPGFYVQYSVNSSVYGTVRPGTEPNENGFYAPGTNITLTAEPATGVSGVTFSHWTVNGLKDNETSTTLSINNINAHKTIQAVFYRNYRVTESADTAGSEEGITLRYALSNAISGDTIDLPASGTITLTSALPQITTSLTIAGNGATLTQSAVTSQLLRIGSGAIVKISRLHFKGARTTSNGGAIYSMANHLILESCIFSDNQATGNSYIYGGAVYAGASSSLTVQGCTFYNNTAGTGGAISRTGATFILTGNLFFGNTAANDNVVNGYASGTTSNDYNVSDKASGTDASAGSGYPLAPGNKFDVVCPLNQFDFKPFSTGAAAGALPSPLPGDYPAVDFYGDPIGASGAAGAVQTLITGGYYLDYGVNHTAFGTVTLNSAPGGNGLFAENTNVTLTAAPSSLPGVVFSHWILNGAKDETEGPLSVVMDSPKSVRAVFMRNFTVTELTDAAGSDSAVTFRYALTNAEDGTIITLPANGTITLTSKLPDITKSLTIQGNGATLTQSNITPSTTSQLLRISNRIVKISRLHFKGARTTGGGGAIANSGDLTLESCIFSDNVTTGSSGQGGAVNSNATTSILTVMGCTFYNNTAYQGGAIYGYKTVVLKGNLFFGNTGTAATKHNVVYVNAGSATSGYNVSDKESGTNGATGSGYAQGDNDLFNVTDIAFATNGDPTTAPSSSSANLKTLTSLPEDFPTTYFDGTTRTLPATAGAVASN